ncbi:MAG: hypothetical protein PHR10_10395 [Sphaerochaetaceae bacterium]|nr:hypothetical protein [Sphaerochaetaceae bacterium]
MSSIGVIRHRVLANKEGDIMRSIIVALLTEKFVCQLHLNVFTENTKPNIGGMYV